MIQFIHGNDQNSKVFYEDLSQSNKQKIGMLLKKYVCQKCFVLIRAVAICLLSRIGCDEPNPDQIQVIRQFMKKKYFAGRQAQGSQFHYRFCRQIIFCIGSPFEYVKSCFPGEALFMRDKEIDCSLGLVFYLTNEEVLIELIYDIQAYQQINFFSFAKIQIGCTLRLKKQRKFKKQRDARFLKRYSDQILIIRLNTESRCLR
ncbi:unnamed protein product [Paramecium octaurelia]|uniref:Uncharacterized protein n=1 Tax=Paramecium octaurelia TaxID=43137 RepID=A0A8S1UB11_PAROT|nr:unnamed protein product [Paramecium octaurelia]